MNLSITEILNVIGGAVHSDEDSLNRTVTGVTWDSRKVISGDVFFALPGEKVDGNDFIAQAVGQGASCVVCTRDPEPKIRAIAGEFTCPIIVVEDAQQALGKMAALWRSKLRALVIGVTGSVGKTSTKDFLRSVLSQRYRTHATEGNHNNELGVPYTILTAPADCEVLIVEMGMRGFGQIESLCKMAVPSIGVVTNVGQSHMELLGSREGIARAKGELLQALPPTGLAVVNADDDMTGYMLNQADISGRGVRIGYFGMGLSAGTRIGNLELKEDGCASFDLAFGMKQPFKVELNIPGRHNVYNALAAALVGNYLGLSDQMIADGLSQTSGSGMRMEIVHTKRGVTVINDAYNANPDSMRAALSTMRAMECEGHRIAVLGDMGELGDKEEELHKQVGVVAASTGLDMLVCVGKLGHSIAQGAAERWLSTNRVVEFDTVEEVCRYLKGAVIGGDLVLVKGSRFMGMERIVEELNK